MHERIGVPVIAVVGDSGAGKTTLLEELLPALADRGLRVGVVKHASHGFEADRPGKDSHRIFGAGAWAVALASDAQLAVFARRAPESPEPLTLAEALDRLPTGCDAVLVEGFAWELVPRVVVVREGTAAAERYTRAGPVLDVIPAREGAAGRRSKTRAPGARPTLSPERVVALADRIAVLALGRAA